MAEYIGFIHFVTSCPKQIDHVSKIYPSSNCKSYHIS